jgi:phenylpyruvate tautomerase PptA (4-oxalocrotonate tautomerase family)
MPTYRCATPKGLLDGAAKATVATRITAAHHEATGAPAAFAQVIFEEIGAGDYYLGGAPLDAPQVFVHGHIRAGRSSAELEQLLNGLTTGVAAAAGVPQASVWVYLSEIPAQRMVEYGRVLPEPGAEAHWLEDLAGVAQEP